MVEIFFFISMGFCFQISGFPIYSSYDDQYEPSVARLDDHQLLKKTWFYMFLQGRGPGVYMHI